MQWFSSELFQGMPCLESKMKENDAGNIVFSTVLTVFRRQGQPVRSEIS